MLVSGRVDGHQKNPNLTSMATKQGTAFKSKFHYLLSPGISEYAAYVLQLYLAF